MGGRRGRAVRPLPFSLEWDCAQNAERQNGFENIHHLRLYYLQR